MKLYAIENLRQDGAPYARRRFFAEKDGVFELVRSRARAEREVRAWGCHQRVVVFNEELDKQVDDWGACAALAASAMLQGDEG